MSLADFFSPVDTKKFNPEGNFYASQLGSKVEIFTNDFPDLDTEKFDIAIIGVLEDRNAVTNQGCALGPDYVREKLYSLYQGSYTTRIVDLGNIKAGFKVTDSYVALKTVVTELIKKDILPLIIGGSQDLTYPQYMAYEDLEQKADLVVVDPKFDLDDSLDTESIER